MPDPTPQFDYAKLPDGSYAKFAKGTSPDVMRGKLVAAGLLKPINEATGSITVPKQGFLSKVAGNVGESVESMAKTPQRLVENTQKYYREGDTITKKAIAPFRAESDELANLLKGVYRSSAPGMIGQPADQSAANALMMMLGEGTKAGRGVSEAALHPKAALSEVMRTAKGEGGPTPLPDPTKSGSLLGAHSRAVDMMNRVDAAAKDVPVNWQPAYEWAQKAVELGKNGFTVPKPITDFIHWVDSRMKPGMENVSGQPGAKIDRGGSANPLLYQDSRNFETSLGAKIPWDQDTGGKMGGIMKKMRESLGQSTAEALRPYNLDTPYLRAKADFSKAYGAEAKWGPFGYFGGKLAGYGIGSVATGHPLILGYAGGKLGEGLAGSMVRSITGEK